MLMGKKQQLEKNCKVEKCFPFTCSIYSYFI